MLHSNRLEACLLKIGGDLEFGISKRGYVIPRLHVYNVIIIHDYDASYLRP